MPQAPKPAVDRHFYGTETRIGELVKSNPAEHACILNIRLSAPAWEGSAPVDWARPDVLESLNREPGSQLVFVDYHFMAGQSNYNEWVFNSADLVSQKVLWAHRMEPQESDRDLECFFAGRQPWLVTIGHVGEEFREQYSVPKLPRHSCTVAPQR
jgi:hypothetical protein